MLYYSEKICQIYDILMIGRNGEIRTHDPLHPMQVRYQAALRPEFRNFNDFPRKMTASESETFL